MVHMLGDVVPIGALNHPQFHVELGICHIWGSMRGDFSYGFDMVVRFIKFVSISGVPYQDLLTNWDQLQ